MSLLAITLASLPTVVTTAATVANARLKRAARAESRERGDALRLLRTAAAAGNRSPGFAAAARSVLHDLTELTGYPVAHVFVATEDGAGLVSSGVWHRPNGLRIDRLVSMSEGALPGAVDGVAGAALSTRQPSWVADITASPSVARYRAASHAGLTSALAVPVLVGYEVVAVIELFSNGTVEPDATTVEVLANVGDHLGRMLEREKAAEDLEEADAELVDLEGALEEATSLLRRSEEQRRKSEKQRRQAEDRIRHAEDQARRAEEQARHWEELLGQTVEQLRLTEEQALQSAAQLRQSEEQLRQIEQERRDSEELLRRVEEGLLGHPFLGLGLLPIAANGHASPVPAPAPAAAGDEAAVAATEVPDVVPPATLEGCAVGAGIDLEGVATVAG